MRLKFRVGHAFPIYCASHYKMLSLYKDLVAHISILHVSDCRNFFKDLYTPLSSFTFSIHMHVPKGFIHLTVTYSAQKRQ